VMSFLRIIRCRETQLIWILVKTNHHCLRVERHSDVLSKNHNMPRDMYQLKKMLSAFSMEYEKIDVCKDNCIFFYKEHKNETNA
jgi:hypothetical protein